MTGDRALVEALRALAAALAELASPHMIIGGVAVIARGVTRLTDDIDATVWAENLELGKLLDVLGAQDITARIPDAQQFAREHQVLLLRHQASATEIDVSLAWLPFEQIALQRAERLQLGGVDLPVAQAEDLVVYKAVAWRDKDRSDIEQLIRLHGHELDLDRIRGLVASFADALEAPERIEEFERLLAAAQRE